MTYIQWRFEHPEFAKTINDLSEPGKVFDGWELVCVHPSWNAEYGRPTYYIATFKQKEERNF